MNINQPLAGRGFAIPFTKAADPKVQLRHEDLTMPLVHRIPDAIRSVVHTVALPWTSRADNIRDSNHFIASIGEFVGTVLFLFFALSATQVANTVNTSSGASEASVGANPQQLQYISLAFGFSLAVNAWVFFRISGGLFNPAVTLGMCLIGALPWFRGFLLFISQLLAGIVAAALVSCMFPGPLDVRTTLGGGTTVTQGVFIEMFLTAQLVFTIFMLAAEKHKGTFIAPVGIGLALFIAELTGVYFTGGSLNPARSFGPAVVDGDFHGYHWIYWVGPTLGSLVAAGFYKFIKILEYETANPGQDLDHDAKVERTRNLLIAAGINESDAGRVAFDLNPHPIGSATGGPNGTVVAHGQGRRSSGEDAAGPYGTRFKDSPSDTTNGQRPHAVTRESGSQPGQHTYLGRAGRNASLIPDTGARTASPAMATHDEIYAPLAASGGDVGLGGAVLDTEKPAYARTVSSGV